MARTRPLTSRPLARWAALSLLLLLWGCGGSVPPERELELTITSAGYAPTRLEARAGELIFIRFRNRDSVAHNLTVELPAGSRGVSAEVRVDAVLTFPAPREPGTYRFYCAVPGHTEEGELVITP